MHLNHPIRNKSTLSLFLACSLAGVAAVADDDFGGWHALSVKTLDTELVDLTSFAQVRFNDDHRNFYEAQVSEYVAVSPHPNLGLGVNYTYLPSRSDPTSDWRYQHRLEFEINPHMRLHQDWNLDLRNRLELRWIEGHQGLNERTRHRLQVTYNVHGLKPLKSIYVNNEFFLTYSKAFYSQNRLVPAGLRFGINPKTSFDLYYMIQSLNSGGEWNHVHIFGTQLSLAF